MMGAISIFIYLWTVLKKCETIKDSSKRKLIRTITTNNGWSRGKPVPSVYVCMPEMLEYAHMGILCKPEGSGRCQNAWNALT